MLAGLSEFEDLGVFDPYLRGPRRVKGERSQQVAAVESTGDKLQRMPGPEIGLVHVGIHFADIPP